MVQVQNSLPASTLPADASPAPVSQTADKEALLARLDALLEQYLHALAQYEVLTQQLGRGMGSAFLALAQANFHTRGPRYGRDSYDGRVQAVRRVAVTATTTTTASGSEGGSEREGGTGTGSTETVRFDAFSTLGPRARQRGEDEDDVGGSAAAGESSAVETAESAAPDTSSTTEPHTAPPNPHTTDTDTATPPHTTDTDTDTTPPAPTDPLRMFGVLVPPALRTAQAHFAAAVEGPVVGLASVAARLRALEREIGRVRKGIRRA